MATLKVDSSEVEARLATLATDVRQPVIEHLRHDEARPLVTAMTSRANRLGRLSSIAARSLEYSAIRDGGRVTGGGSSSSNLSAVLFAGTEYGGRKRRTTYARRSPKGNSHAVTRRTTMMFRPHLGTRGYWFWPSVRNETRGIVKRVRNVIEGAI